MLRIRSGSAAVAATALLILLAYDLFYFYHYGIDISATGSNRSVPASEISTSAGSLAGSNKQTSLDSRVAVVVASLARDNTTWITDRLRDWTAHIYVVDDAGAQLTVPTNKGREAMVFLTYIIDTYHKLPEYVIFRHSSRFQWHSDDPDYDGLALLRRIRLPYVQSEGYVSLRCAWDLGCPTEIRPFEDEGSLDPYKETASHYRKAFAEIFPGLEIPTAVGQTCCAQFAVTRTVILSRDLSEYQHMRDWLIHTDLDDSVSGRVFEYLWHIIFGKEAVHCPAEGNCYCKLFGLCDCEDKAGECGKYYTLPAKQLLPEGWPYVGWDGSARNYTAPEWR